MSQETTKQPETPDGGHEHLFDEIRFRTYTLATPVRKTVILRCGCGHQEEHPVDSVEPFAG